MLKVFCDRCEKPMPKGQHDRVIKILGRFQVEIIACVDKVWNGGHLCHRCVVDIVNKGKPTKTARP